eukprot:200841_1
MSLIYKPLDRAHHSLPTSSPAEKLRALLSTNKRLIVPVVYDGLTARLVKLVGFEAAFMGGFGVSAVHGCPDTGLLGYGEMVSQAKLVTSQLGDDIPCIGDGDIGYGNEMNVKRTVHGYAKSGIACIMIEDQVAPKRCGHTRGKSVVSREKAVSRIKAACDARSEGADILIMARTDARCISMNEAIIRCQEFRKAGADITFLEAPETEEEMIRYCKEVDGPKMANMIEYGKTPILPPQRLEEMGYQIIVYPLTLLSASIKSMKNALEHLKVEESTDSDVLSFTEVQHVVGFDEYYKEEQRYAEGGGKTK